MFKLEDIMQEKITISQIEDAYEELAWASLIHPDTEETETEAILGLRLSISELLPDIFTEIPEINGDRLNTLKNQDKLASFFGTHFSKKITSKQAVNFFQYMLVIHWSSLLWLHLKKIESHKELHDYIEHFICYNLGLFIYEPILIQRIDKAIEAACQDKIGAMLEIMYEIQLYSAIFSAQQMQKAQRLNHGLHRSRGKSSKCNELKTRQEKKRSWFEKLEKEIEEQTKSDSIQRPLIKEIIGEFFQKHENELLALFTNERQFTDQFNHRKIDPNRARQAALSLPYKLPKYLADIANDWLHGSVSRKLKNTNKKS